MALPGPAELFPPIELQDAAGRSARLPEGAGLYAFFKTTCPTSELTWPYLERIRRFADGGTLSVVAVSQDEPEETREFNRRTGVRLRTVYDPRPWSASEALGLTTVPALFLVRSDGRVEQRVIGFQKAKMEELASRAAALAGRAPRPLFEPGDAAPAIRPG